MSSSSSVLDIAAYYDSVADCYDSLYIDSFSVAENNIIAGMLIEFKPVDAKILDLGCGYGLGYELLAPAFGENDEYIGIDLSDRMIAKAEYNFRYTNFAYDDIHFEVGDMVNLSRFKDRSFNYIISTFGSISHASDIYKVFDEINRVCKNGGHIFLMFYSRFSFKNIAEAVRAGSVLPLEKHRPYNIRNNSSDNNCASAYFYTSSEIHNMAARYFEDIQIFGLNSWNAIDGLPLENISIDQAEWLLKTEQKRLSATPDVCHSIIVRAVKP